MTIPKGEVASGCRVLAEHFNLPVNYQRGWEVVTIATLYQEDPQLEIKRLVLYGIHNGEDRFLLQIIWELGEKVDPFARHVSLSKNSRTIDVIDAVALSEEERKEYLEAVIALLGGGDGYICESLASTVDYNRVFETVQSHLENVNSKTE